MRSARAVVICGYPPRYVFIPLFIILASAFLMLAGCNDDSVLDPGGCGDDCPDEPVCSDTLPSVQIECPPADAILQYPPEFPIVLSIENPAATAGLRYLLTKIGWGEDDGIVKLNEHPEEFEGLWSDWEKPAYNGKKIHIGADEPLDRNYRYLFAVQLVDSCGQMDTLFTHEKNARQFIVFEKYPLLTVAGKMLGSCDFWGTYQHPEPIFVPPGVPLAFRWGARKTWDYSCTNIEYRYGWDVQNLDDDDAWTKGWNPRLYQSFERPFYSGVHVLYIEAREDYNRITRARIEIEIMPFRADRDLLWVDDWFLGDAPLPNMMLPTEEIHDEFWTGLCSRVPGFNPAIDIFPADELTTSLRGDPIPLEVLSRYKHVIWTYSNSREHVWKNTVPFSPEPLYSGFRPNFRPNTLALYLAGGGSVLTCGRSDLGGSALSATFADPPTFPASVLDEYVSNGILGSDPGKYSMAWDDYYVTVVDKVIGTFKTGEGMPSRRLDQDALRMIVEPDPGSHPDLPDTLALWEEVTKPGMFFDPMVRGFYYVEVYDPGYYMDVLGLRSRDCFTPMYLMRARNTRSPINMAAVALVATRPSCEDWGRIAYESYHFGVPLWFFDHDKVEQIIDYIFDQWDVK
jgi:hypothetical protein